VLAADVTSSLREREAAAASRPAADGEGAPAPGGARGGGKLGGEGAQVDEGVPSVGPRADRAPTAAPDRTAARRAAIANLMSRSNAEIPHYYVAQTMDLAASLDWLSQRNAGLPPALRLLPAVLFLRATALAAQVVPDLNGHWTDGALHRAERVDLGVAIARRGGGLVTPAIPDAGGLRAEELMKRLGDLVARARRGSLRRSEMAGASITVSSLGESGPEALFGVIFPPQVALVCVGGIQQRPWAVDGMLAVRPTATIVLAADHRASDGRTASAFLAAFSDALSHPEEL
jgi:pyruvate dehydrogenase E2 component (dihydrolipoamide acetyltransferase)